MAGKFRNKYRIESTRAQWWNYSWNGYYFITICTYHRLPYFGSIINNQMQLSFVGRIAFECWEAIPQHFPFVKLHLFVIMPNHIHGIVVIDRENKLLNNQHSYLTLSNSTPQVKNKFGPQSKNLGSIIRGYKIGVKKLARVVITDFDWQRRYDDHIIRNKSEYIAISKYIFNNPTNWSEDEFFL